MMTLSKSHERSIQQTMSHGLHQEAWEQGHWATFPD